MGKEYCPWEEEGKVHVQVVRLVVRTSDRSWHVTSDATYLPYMDHRQ